MRHQFLQTDEDVADFIDRYVTCKQNNDIKELINYQTHRHAHTCLKNGNKICRFGFPLPPLHKP